MTSIIADINDNRHVFKSSVDQFFSKINISKQLKSSNFYKESGFSCTQMYFASPKSSKLQRKIPTPTWGNLASGG